MRNKEEGVVAPLIAACLLGLMALMYTLIFDNYIVAIHTTTFRSKVQKLCSDVASEAPIHADVVRLFAEKIDDLSKNKLPSWFEVVSAELTMGTMPEGYLASNTNIGQDRITSCGFGTPGFSVSAGNINSYIQSIIGTSAIKFTFNWDLCKDSPSGYFKDKWGILNVSKDYHAGTFVGCEVKGRIKTYFSPREVSPGIEIREGEDAMPKTRIVYSRFGFWKFPWTDDNPTTEPQGLVIAIAPQIPYEPNNPTLTTPAIAANQFFADYLNRGNYLGIVSGNMARLNPPPTSYNNSYVLAPALFDSDTFLNDTQKRDALFKLFAGAPTVIRQRVSSALIELASRDGMLRSNTAVLLSNPRTEIGTIDINPPIILRDFGEDLRAANINNTPLLFTQYADHLNTAVKVNPYYAISGALPAANLPSTIQTEVSSLVSRLPSMGLHLDSSMNWHATRLFRDSGSLIFPFSSLLNGTGAFSFEPADYSWGETSNEGYNSYMKYEFESGGSSHSDYFDRLNHFNYLSGITDANNLNVSQLARTLGPSVKCPYRLQRGTTPICDGFQGFHPDIEGVLKAWLGLPGEDTSMSNRDNTSSIPDTTGSTGTKFNAVKMPGLYSNSPGSYTNWGNNARPSQLVLILHSHLLDNTLFSETEQVQHVSSKVNSIRDPITKLPIQDERPITIIYIPTRTQDSSQNVVQYMANYFQANICNPSERQDYKRGNVLIPLVHNSSSYSTSYPNISCIAETYPCTKKANLQEVWDCMLSDDASENFAKQIFSQTIMRTTRIF